MNTHTWDCVILSTNMIGWDLLLWSDQPIISNLWLSFEEKQTKPTSQTKLSCEHELKLSAFKLTNMQKEFCNFAGIGIWISTNIIIGFRISTNRKPDQDRSRQNLSFWQSMAAKNEHSFKCENRTHDKSDYHARCQRNVEETNWQIVLDLCKALWNSTASKYQYDSGASLEVRQPSICLRQILRL